MARKFPLITALFTRKPWRNAGLIAATLICTCCASYSAAAAQFKTFKDLQVHYIAFNSTFLTPTIAKQYQLTRNPYTAIINISVLDKSQLGTPAVTANIHGQAKNLLGQMKSLHFKQVKEGPAVYYLAELPITNRETFRFNIAVDSGNKGAGQLKFIQKFYVEDK